VQWVRHYSYTNKTCAAEKTEGEGEGWKNEDKDMENLPGLTGEQLSKIEVTGM